VGLSDRLLTLREAADRLNVGYTTVRELVNDGLIPVVPMGKTARGWRIRPEALDLFIEETECRSAKLPTRATRKSRGSRRSTAPVSAGSDADSRLNELLGSGSAHSRPPPHLKAVP
jgi:excisionase family DNA binding protein